MSTPDAHSCITGVEFVQAAGAECGSGRRVSLALQKLAFETINTDEQRRTKTHKDTDNFLVTV
jgi:hypothetical protein